VVVGLGIRPSVCLGQILQSSDEIRSGNGVLAFGTKEFRNLVLFDPEVEICGPSDSTWRGENVSRGCGVVVPIKINIASTESVVVVVVFWGHIDVVTSSSSHLGFVKALKSLI
jgi:hypothetical protein